MRLNASIATLVLAGLSLSPATLLAKPAHHVVRKNAASQTSEKKRTHKQKADESATPKPHGKRHRKGRSQQQEAPEPVVVNRVHATVPSRKNRTHRATAEQNRDLPAAATRKATSEDFLRAAAGTSPATEKPVTGVSHPQDDDEETPRSASPATKTASVAKPTPVVNVIRPTAERPQLESVEEEASTPVILPSLYNKRGHLIVPPPLKGSHEILVRQNQVADREGLDRIKDDADLEDMRAHRLLVALPVNSGLQVDERLPVNRRYCRPWTAQFLAALSRAHYARFHTPLQVNSAVRTVEFQQHLQRVNGNAAPAEGETASPHLTGQAVDLAKHGLSLTEIAWMRGYLLPLVQEGKIDVEEEFQQACFHISVYKKYLPPASTPRREIATGQHREAALGAAVIR